MGVMFSPVFFVCLSVSEWIFMKVKEQVVFEPKEYVIIPT